MSVPLCIATNIFFHLGVNGSLAGGKTLGLHFFSLRCLQMFSHGLPGLRGAGEKPILFHVRVTCSFWLDAFQILSLILEFRNSTRVCRGMCFDHQPYQKLEEAFPYTDAGFSLGKCPFLLKSLLFAYWVS